MHLLTVMRFCRPRAHFPIHLASRTIEVHGNLGMPSKYTSGSRTILGEQKGCHGQYATCIATCNRIVAVVEESEGSRVFVYGGKNRQEFKRHAAKVSGLIHVEDNVVASVDKDGKGIVWNAAKGTVITGFQVSGEKFDVFRKIGPSSFAAQSESGKLYILSHNSGRNVKEMRTLKLGKFNYVIAAHINILLVQHLQEASLIRNGDGVVVFDTETGDQLGHLNKKKAVVCAAINHWHIVTGCSDKKLYVFRKRSNFELAKTIDMENFMDDEDKDDDEIEDEFDIEDDDENDAETEVILDITFIHSDLLMVTMFRSGVYFISIAKETCIARIIRRKTDIGITSSAILADGRICLGGEYQFHAIYPTPAVLRRDIEEYTERNFSFCEIGRAEMHTWKDKVAELKEEALKIKMKMDCTSAEIVERGNEMEKMKEKIATQKMEIQQLKEQQSKRINVMGYLFSSIRESVGLDEREKNV